MDNEFVMDVLKAVCEIARVKCKFNRSKLDKICQ